MSPRLKLGLGDRENVGLPLGEAVVLQLADRSGVQEWVPEDEVVCVEERVAV